MAVCVLSRLARDELERGHKLEVSRLEQQLEASRCLEQQLAVPLAACAAQVQQVLQQLQEEGAARLRAEQQVTHRPELQCHCHGMYQDMMQGQVQGKP